MKRIGLVSLVFLFFIFRISDSCAQGTTTPTFEDMYSKKLGNLRLSSTKFDLGRVKSNEYINDTIRIYNAGKIPMKISITQKIPAYMRVLVRGTPLFPGGYGYISLTYDCSRRNDLGFTMDQVQLVTNDSSFLLKNIYITATIEEYFPPSVMGDSLRAKIRVSEKFYSYNRVKQGEKISHDFKIYNDGKKLLLLHKIKSDSPSVKYSLTKKEVNAGDSAIMHVEFDTYDKTGKDFRKISLFSNDALISEFVFELNGEILK
jgi:hypothetical protein